MNLSGFWTAPFPSDSTPAWPDDELILPGNSPGSIFEISDLESSIENGQCSVATSYNSETAHCQEGAIPSPQELVPVRKKPMPRKGHTKSRKGCFGCKRRKIKCPETRPACEKCLKAEIPCEYPKSQQQEFAFPSPAAALQSTPTMFSMTDMRLFHHFVVRAYPTLPIGGDDIWTIEMPAFAHEYEYLMRSMLALGASSLVLTTSSSAEVSNMAIAHRVEAVKLLNKALSRPATCREEADARFAAFMTSYISATILENMLIVPLKFADLTFQSTCMEDGMIDFLTMLRGCIFQGDLGEFSAFACFFDQNSHIETVAERFDQFEKLELDIDNLDEGQQSMAALEPFCRTDCEKRYHTHLTALVKNCRISPKAAYLDFVNAYNIVGTISHSEFQQFIDRSNAVAQLLMSHFIAGHVLLRNITMYETKNRDMAPIYKILTAWCQKIHNNLDPVMRKYNEWPVALVLSVVPLVEKSALRKVDGFPTKRLLGSTGFF